MIVKEEIYNHEKGNVLFLILIAVELFAALSYAVTQSSRSSGGDVSRENARLIASNFMSLFSQIDSAVTRLQISSGCADDEMGLAPAVISKTGNIISDVSIFGDGSTANLASYGTAPTLQWGYNRRADGSCDIFGTNGGNVMMTITQTSEDQLKIWGNYLFSALEVVPMASQNLTAINDLYIGFWADGSAASEVVSARPVCEIINQLASVSFPSASGASTSWAGSGIGSFWGERTYCLFDPPANVALIHIIAEK
ncbi:MAG: hypothetical protein AUJ12_07240 [Alphaproteobacteria bacterium CG1_02_46_17]|nr:MAG: hypothetical protein AUJ12_07240 [Alphaproteobacteria bacterium CG1_02_46_17]